MCQRMVLLAPYPHCWDYRCALPYLVFYAAVGMASAPSCLLPMSHTPTSSGVFMVSHRNSLAIITLAAHSDWGGLETELISAVSPENQAWLCCIRWSRKHGAFPSSVSRAAGQQATALVRGDERARPARGLSALSPARAQLPSLGCGATFWLPPRCDLWLVKATT